MLRSNSKQYGKSILVGQLSVLSLPPCLEVCVCVCVRACVRACVYMCACVHVYMFYIVGKVDEVVIVLDGTIG